MIISLVRWSDHFQVMEGRRPWVWFNCGTPRVKPTLSVMLDVTLLRDFHYSNANRPYIGLEDQESRPIYQYKSYVQAYV